jgi:LPS export ABC transporter protein LptC
MSSHRFLVITALTLLLGGVGLAIWNANRSAAPQKAPAAQVTQQSPEMVGRNVSFIITEGEVKKWKLEAAQVIYNESRTEAHLKDVKGEFFDKDGKSVMRFTAPEGEYANQNNHVLLKGGVVAVSTQENGGELRAPQMTWDAKAKEVLASGGVELIHAQGKSLAQSCRFDLGFTKIALLGGVTSTVTSP